MLAVETVGLCHAYRNRTSVVSDLNLAVPRGSIYGFLGPNGAGKTTTLRLLLGLLRVQVGSIRVHGLDPEHHRRLILARTGSLIESPSLYGHLSAAENLRLWQVIHGCSKSRIKEVLLLTGLPETGRQPVREFSMGMRQRLGVATALLGSPELLVLDEPTNGLDPAGIIDMRDLLRRLNRETGVTVLVSSHLLSEVEKLVTHIGVIKRGQLVFQGPLSEVVDRARESAHGVMNTDDDLLAVALLRGAGIPARYEADHVSLPALPLAELAIANRMLVNAGVGVHGIGAARRDLESIFMNLVRD